MKKSLFIINLLVLTIFFTNSCSHKTSFTNNTKSNTFGISNKEITTSDFIVLTKRLLKQIIKDDYFKNNINNIYINDIDNKLVKDYEVINAKIRNEVIDFFKNNNIKVNTNKNRTSFFIDIKYFISKIHYSEYQKPLTALNINLYLTNSKQAEIKAWNDYLIYAENFNLWQ